VRRNFPAKIKRQALARAAGKCEKCHVPTGPHNPPEVDHDKEDWEGGEPVLENAVVLGRKCCHETKTAAATSRRAKADAARARHLDQKPKSNLSRPRERRPVLAIDGDAKADRLRAKHDEFHRKRRIGP
jgi:hypothetical protein